MTYHKDKHKAFQAAQDSVKKAMDVHQQVENMKTDAQFGHEVGHLWEEVNEAYQQVENAYEVASEHQRRQLDDFRQSLEQIVDHLDEYDEIR